MINIENALKEKFSKLHDTNGAAVVIANKDALAIEIIAIIKNYVKERDERTYQGIKGIGDRIQETKNEIIGTLPEGAVSEAKIELDAVIESTENATNKILDASESIQALVGSCSDKGLADKIMADIGAIMEACNFQDLTGQRIKKVMATLKYIESSVGGMLESFAEHRTPLEDKRPDATLMNGPQLQNEAPSQDDVDKLFDSA